jgi:hypothetical protein
VSPATQQLFTKLNLDNIQYFDVLIKSSSVNINDYKIVNITDKIDCADFSASDLETYDNGDIKDINKLVLDTTKIPSGKKMFLLGRRATAIIIIHADLKNSIEEAKLAGFRFFGLDEADQLY